MPATDRESFCEETRQLDLQVDTSCKISLSCIEFCKLGNGSRPRQKCFDRYRVSDHKPFFGLTSNSGANRNHRRFASLSTDFIRHAMPA